MSARYVDALFRAVSSPTKLDLQNILSALSSATGVAAAAPLDHLYARIGALNGPFFPAGWGNLGVVNYEEDLRHLIQGPPSSIKLSWRLVERGTRDGADYLLYEGTFRTPCLQRVFDALPPESRTGRVQLLMPARLQAFDSHQEQRQEQQQQQAERVFPGPMPMLGAAGGQSRESTRVDGPAAVLHLAATGDQTFGRRLRLGAPLLRDNVCTLVLESPFYGSRRPAAQRGSKLLRVSDLLTLGWATIAESVNLLHWLREQGFGPLGMCGLSMGGVHASMTAGLYPGDVAVTPLLAPRSAAVAYCDGAMRAVMAWEPLLKEVDENENHITQVVLSAGRAVTLQLPGSGGSGGSGAGGGSVQSVALMREATYALADLETVGEKRHMAAAAVGAAAGAVEGSASEAAAVGGGPGGAMASSGAEVGAAAAAAAGGAAGLLRGLPTLSIMDLYSALAGTALRAAGRADGPHQQQQCQRQHQEYQDAAAVVGQSAQSQADGSFSGAPHLQRPWQPHAHTHAHTGGAGGDGSSRGATGGSGAAGVNGADPWVARPHAPPHGADMPFPPHRPEPRHPSPSLSGDGSGSGEAAAAAQVPGPGAGGTGGAGGGTALGRRLLGDLGRAVRQLRAGDRRLDNPETVMRLKRVLETYTDITRYPRPRRADAAVIVAARDDAYVSTESVRQLHAYWAGSELRVVSGGHVSAFLMHQDAFRTAIRDSLARVSRPPPPQS